MKYLELVIHTNRAGLEPLEACLMEMGLNDMVVNDPMDLQDLMNKKHDYDWDYIGDEVLEMADTEPTITLYFDGDETGNGYALAQEVDLKVDELRQAMMNGEYGENADFGPLTVTTTLHDDSEWKDNWKEYFKPSRVSDKILVCPTWEEYELSDEEKAQGVKILKIDPGMAFGTGTHETTSLCMKAMEKYMKKGASVLDVGCGSGILSIAADLLGAGDVLGIEIDPVAVEVSRENLELNACKESVRVIEGDLTKGVDYEADIVVANLMADLVMMLTPDVRRHMKEGAKYISSGIIDEKLEEVKNAVIASGFNIDEVMTDGMWCA
ncbi:MAG: 50S ribosomal protein L11 methyltransferase, partial [Bacteroidales bacterium]|nr:50S ribosomal protein L11 methyltransferase [Bacteroidales bacterium]